MANATPSISSVPRDHDPPHLSATRARGSAEWHNWIMDNATVRLSYDEIERQIFNSLIPLSLNEIINQPTDLIDAQILLDRRVDRINQGCSIC
jgi:hypothetical protein